MTDADKQAECLRICGPDVHPDMHRTAPEMCPVLLDWWKNPTSRPNYRMKEFPFTVLNKTEKP
jgi:hypothetical protein